ncbi:hypothetical protein SLITO_v1c05710 [Spiroplasma litorale]|uniref:ABC transporter domain-containing protein n=1 Tax=Spiroplasma litorale TaxID=216942 RepID=A0A0K1W277_9MOLU|nr:ATP-binding cassette domain-containing protein [Spiroplasma litorale]AKX34207.1 hypothetical protein SLITO_v1c05710 [Spiroplasma litorale]
MITFSCPFTIAPLIIFSGYIFATDSSKIATLLSIFLISIGMMFLPLMQLINNLNKDKFNFKYDENTIKKENLNELVTDLTISNLSMTINNKSIFKDVNFTFKNKLLNYIQGKNGVGKLVLLKCIAVIITDYEGEISINKSLSSDHKYSISYIGHDSWLFNISIKDNLAYGCNDVDEKEIYKLLEKFNLLEKINKLNLCLDTIFEDDVNLFSKGNFKNFWLSEHCYKIEQ